MTSVLIFPYRTPSAQAISEPVWTVNGSSIDSVDLTGVDYYATIHVRCAIIVDLEELKRSTCQQISELAFILTARSDTAGLFSTLCSADVAEGEVDLGGDVAVADLGDLATLQVQLLRTRVVAPEPDSLIARHKGAVLWSRDEKLRLSGVGSRLSVRAVDLSVDPMLRGVLWQVELDRSDLYSSVSSVAQVSLNSRHPELIALLQSTDEQGLAARILRRQLQLDVARQFVLAAREFENDEGADVLAALPYDSIGAVSIRFAEKVRASGGLASRSELWSLFDSNPASFELILQATYLAPALETH